MSFNFITAVTICSDFGALENKVCHCFHCFPINFPWSDGTGCHDLSGMLSFKPAFSLSSFTFIKRSFSSSSLSAILVVSSACLRLLIFLSAILIAACASSSLAHVHVHTCTRTHTHTHTHAHVDFPGGARGKESICQCRRGKRHGFDPWVGKIPWRRKWEPTLLFLPVESHGQRSLAGYSP